MPGSRLLVARHAEAEYETELLSDDGGSLTGLGREQAIAFGAALQAEAIVHVWTSPMARSVQTAEIVAAVLGCGVTVREGLREFGVGAHAGEPLTPDPLGPVFLSWLRGDLDARVDGGESGHDVVGRVTAVLTEVAAAHEEESVLVLSHGGAICTGVPALAENIDSRFPIGRSLPNCGVVEVAADGSHWSVTRWLEEDVSARSPVD